MTRLRCLIVSLAAAGALALLPAWALGMSNANETVNPTGPVVKFSISPDLNCDVAYVGDSHGEFFGDTACATLISTQDGAWGPSSIPAGQNVLSNLTSNYELVSQTSSGSGSGASPYAITTTVKAGSILLTQVDSYVQGSQRLQTSMTLTNQGPDAVSFDLFRAGDCYARDSDIGYGQMGTESAACVSSVQARTVRFLATPSSPGAQPVALTFEGYYNDLWSRIATFLPGGSRTDFDGNCRCTESIDNSAGLQWNVSLAPGEQKVIRSGIDFGPIASTGGFGTQPNLWPGGKPYVALGDSYSSGEGAGLQKQHAGYDYFSNTNAPGVNTCHRSKNAYPMLIANYFGLNVDRDVTFRACSGAVIQDLEFNEDNQHGGSDEPPQLNWLGSNTQLVTLTMGGNDAHFSDIVTACVVPTGVECQQLYGSVADSAYAVLSLDNGPGLFPAYQKILDRVGPGSNLVVFGYPDFVPFRSIRGARCKTADTFTASESVWLSGQIRKFNSLIAQKAAQAGAIFIDDDRLFNPPGGPNHRICSSDEWVNGIRGLAASESFHPNKLGHDLGFFTAFRRVYVNGDSNESLSGGPGGLTFSREHEISASASHAPTTLVIRKDSPATLAIDVAAGQTTITSLHYPGAVPTISLTDPAGNPVTIAAMDPARPLNRIQGASSMAAYSTTALELRGMAPGTYTLSVQLPDSAPTDAGVMSARFTKMAEANQPPIPLVTSRLKGRRTLILSAARSTDPEGRGLSYQWTFGDGTAGSTNTTARHTFKKEGRYTVGLTVSDPAGGVSKQAIIVETRKQSIASVSFKKARNAVKVTLTCKAKNAVGACEMRLNIALRRTTGGRPLVRQLDFAARPGRADTQVLTLPGSARRPFDGSGSAKGSTTDHALRPDGGKVSFAFRVAKGRLILR